MLYKINLPITGDWGGREDKGRRTKEEGMGRGMREKEKRGAWGKKGEQIGMEQTGKERDRERAWYESWGKR